MNTLLLFLSLYGTSVTPPDLIPAWPNFFQPHGQQTTFKFNNISEPDSTLNEFSFTWEVAGQQWQIFQLPLDSIRPDSLHPQFCEGQFYVSLTATHNPTGAIFERTECAHVVWSYYNGEPCPGPCTMDSTFYDFYPNVEPYYFRISNGMDHNSDGLINAPDLLFILAAIQ